MSPKTCKRLQQCLISFVFPPSIRISEWIFLWGGVWKLPGQSHNYYPRSCFLGNLDIFQCWGFTVHLYRVSIVIYYWRSLNYPGFFRVFSPSVWKKLVHKFHTGVFLILLKKYSHWFFVSATILSVHIQVKVDIICFDTFSVFFVLAKYFDLLWISFLLFLSAICNAGNQIVNRCTVFPNVSFMLLNICSTPLYPQLKWVINRFLMWYNYSIYMLQPATNRSTMLTVVENAWWQE